MELNTQGRWNSAWWTQYSMREEFMYSFSTIRSRCELCCLAFSTILISIVDVSLIHLLAQYFSQSRVYCTPGWQ